MTFALLLLAWMAGNGGELAARNRPEPNQGQPKVVWLEPLQCGFDIRTEEGLSNLVRMADLWIELSKAQESALTTARKRMVAATPLREMPYAQLKEYFSEPADYISPKDRRGLQGMKRCATEALGYPSSADREHCLGQIFELAAAVNNNHRSVVPEKLGLSEIPMLLRRCLHNPVAKGNRPAANLEPLPNDDLSRANPGPSPFWEPRSAISAQELYAGYGRPSMPDLTNCVWTYDGPKTGSGISPGFQAERGKTKVKVKFQEISSEPFTARIFWALGYHVDPVDYAPFLKLRYDRRFLRELNLRHESPIAAKFLGLTLFRFHYQPRYDPFEFIAEAVLKDGSHIPGAGLKRLIYRDPNVERPEEDPANFRPEIEERIDYLITCPASVQIRNEHLKSIGPWDFQGLGHEDLRELRAAGLAAAWLNWCDAQFPNTRVRLNKRRKGAAYEHYFCDLGGGMGSGTGSFFRRFESPNDLDWAFTEPGKVHGQGRMTVPFRVVGYKPTADVAAFKAMTVDDARWMARRIGQLTEHQLLEALIASGFDSAQAKAYLEKLISRRDRMIHDLGLAQEVPLLRPDGPRKDLSYNPRVDGPLRIRLCSGQTVQAQPADWIVAHGEVVLNPAVRSASGPKRPVHEPRILSQRNAWTR